MHAWISAVRNTSALKEVKITNQSMIHFLNSLNCTQWLLMTSFKKKNHTQKNKTLKKKKIQKDFLSFSKKKKEIEYVPYLKYARKD